MKRKRGNKKGKSKRSKAATSKGSSKKIDSHSDIKEIDPKEHDFVMEVDSSSSSGTDQPSDVANVNPDESIDKSPVKSAARVKVKLKTRKVLEVRHTSSDAPSQNDSDRSGPELGLDNQSKDEVNLDDGFNSVSEMVLDVPENVTKKTGSIKIKTPRAIDSPGNQNDDNLIGDVGNSHQKPATALVQSSRYNREDLDSALMVIKKVMKMDAAEHFNVPVDPVALGIPDYFTVINTPMDFGTICSNLENGVKYHNSEDVFKDVRFIWENCYKYNKKGDYIVDLMRRVKKNFIKYWTTAGLYSENDGLEEEGTSTPGKGSSKGGYKYKGRKRPGMRRHKNDCLCAICVLRRQKREREAKERLAWGQSGDNDESKMEEESPSGDESSSDTGDSPGKDADVEQADKGEVKAGTPQDMQQQQTPSDKKEEDDEDDNDGESKNEMDIQKSSEQLQSDKYMEGEPEAQKTKLESSSGIQENIPKEIEKEETTAQLEQKQRELKEKLRRVQLNERYYKNPMFSSLGGFLFPDDENSIWNGPHSLAPRSRSSQASPFTLAIRSLMK